MFVVSLQLPVCMVNKYFLSLNSLTGRENEHSQDPVDSNIFFSFQKHLLIARSPALKHLLSTSEALAGTKEGDQIEYTETERMAVI